MTDNRTSSPASRSLGVLELRGFGPAIALICASLAFSVVVGQGFVPFGQRLLDPIDNPLLRLLSWLDGIATGIVPFIGMIVLFWGAFTSPPSRRRYLWSGILLLTSAFAAAFLDVIVLRVIPNTPGTGRVHAAIDIGLSFALLFYGALYVMAAAKGMTRRGRAICAIIAVVIITPVVVFPYRWPVLLTTLLATAGFWTLGVSIADRSGFDPYADD
jgi:hypothetical protein